MTVLVLRLAGPLQAFGGYRELASKDAVSPTAFLPRKSAINGMIGAALGTRSLNLIGARYSLAVRVERTNPNAEDYQVLGLLPAPVQQAAERLEKIGTGRSAARVPVVRSGDTLKTSKIQRKDYLSHSEFIVAVEPDAPDLTEMWLKAFQSPVFPVYLGRKSCLPSWPFLLGIWRDSTTDLFHSLPHAAGGERGEAAAVRAYLVVGDYDNHQVTPLPITGVTHVSREEQMQWVQQCLMR